MPEEKDELVYILKLRCHFLHCMDLCSGSWRLVQDALNSTVGQLILLHFSVMIVILISVTKLCLGNCKDGICCNPSDGYHKLSSITDEQ